MYPKPMSPSDLASILQIGHDLTQSLDINIMETMDSSEGTNTYGNNDLTEEVKLPFIFLFCGNSDRNTAFYPKK